MKYRLGNVITGLVAAAGLLATLPAMADADAAEAARQAALEAGAAELAAELLADGEESLSRARRYAEQQDAERAAREYDDAIEEFLEAEVTAIEARILGEAGEALKQANLLRAKKYAPRTLARAQSLLNDAMATLQADRTATAAATAQAGSAAATARLAARISQTAREKPSVEDLILERAAGIWSLQAAAGLPQVADQNPDIATEALAREITRMREAELRLGKDLDDSRAFVAALEEEIRVLDERLGGATEERRELVMRLEQQARKREQLEQAQALFTEAEAEVFSQSDRIVARLIGLQFASGSAEISADNDTLFAKIAKLLAIYPSAAIAVEGHTDSRGSDRLNQLLSQNRANTVMERIITANSIAPEQITATGYGSARPLASNETEEGRRTNRRIDLVITPAN